MKAFTDEQALELGRSILSRFEDGLNGKKWLGRSVILPFQLNLTAQAHDKIYPRDGTWTSDVELKIPSFIRVHGPNYEDWEHITLDEWLDESKPQKSKLRSKDHGNL